MTEPFWRRIVSGPMTGAANMALDEALFRSVQAGNSPPVLRLYRWHPATVTLGYGQRGDRQVNLSACDKLGVDVVRRLTGGRAVLHATEMTYAVITPETGIFSANILDNYRRIAAALQHCLQQLGLAVEMVSGRHESQGTSSAEQSACFTAPSYFELSCNGRKICGSAQKRDAGCFLQHGSLPVELDPVMLFSTLNCESDLDAEAGGRSLARHVGWINRWLEHQVTVEQVEEQFTASFAHIFPGRFVDDQPTAPEIALAKELEQIKYANPAWTMKGIADS
jgi:lipoate-protein ligase A